MHKFIKKDTCGPLAMNCSYPECNCGEWVNVSGIESLTKENFWNGLHAKYPEAVDDFCKWIDGYKKEVQWNQLFHHYGVECHVKFHDLPFDMQIGILMRYMEDRRCQVSRAEYVGSLKSIVTAFFSQAIVDQRA